MLFRFLLGCACFAAILILAAKQADSPGGGGHAPWTEHVRFSDDAPGITSKSHQQNARAWAVGKLVMVENNGKLQVISLPEPVESLQKGGSPGADLTARTSRRAYAMGFQPKLRKLYAYPLVSSRHDHIIIDKSENTLFFYHTGRLAARYRVATGKFPHYTPEGMFTIAVKLKDPEGPGIPNPQLGRRWMGLAVPNAADKRGPPGDRRAPAGQKYGIHGTNEPESIGKHESGGCVRMRDADILHLYEMVEVGTTVEIQP